MAIRYDFSGRVTLVTGGSSGLGEAIALRDLPKLARRL